MEENKLEIEEPNSSSYEKDDKTQQCEFKKPVLIGRIGKLPKKAKDIQNTEKVDKRCDENVDKTLEDNAESSSLKDSLPPSVSPTELSMPIPYKEPKWSGLCPDGSDYALEVLKSGTIEFKVELTKKPYCTFGRMTTCDVVLTNPSVSRYHAVLQYRAFADEGEPAIGWYLYDPGSTHGTYLNKQQLKSAHYTRVRVGHHIKFGNSTKSFILLGPDFDCEGESELSVTEIKKRALEMKLEKEKMIQEAAEQRKKELLEMEKKREEDGIDWGMGEDAEEETDLTENPYASTANEELYLDDPKKTLRGYYEREGYELTYDCEERGIGQFLCRVELPIDDARGRPMVAEVLHRGKKKEAVVACALEACRILDRAGLLRQAKHESRRRKQRDWSADDYYDSDEDTFLDRTGAVEKKRTLRMQRLGAEQAQQDAPLTYDDLIKQISNIEKSIYNEEKTLERLRAHKPEKNSDEDVDSLDSYMSSLGQKKNMAEKAEISKTKMNIQKLKTELVKTQKLADIARPAHLPPLVKKDDKKMAVKIAANVVYGKRIRLKDNINKRPKPEQKVYENETDFVEEMDSDEETENSDTKPDLGNIKMELKESKNIREINEETSSRNEDKIDVDAKAVENKIKSKKVQGNIRNTKNNKEETQGKVFGPMRPPENYVIPENYFEESSRDLPEAYEEDAYS